MKLTSYLDYYNWDLQTQIKLFYTNKLDFFVLRRIAGNSFLDYKLYHEDIVNDLKKVKVLLFDPLLDPIDFDNEESIENLTSATIFAKQLRAKNIVIKIKRFNKDLIDKTILELYFKQVLKITKDLNLIIRIDEQNDLFIYNLISNTIRSRKIQIIYNPAQIYSLDYSPITSYRLLKNKIGAFEVADIDEDKEAILIGHGIIDIKGLFKNLYRDHYQRLIILNSNLDEVFKNFGISKEEIDRRQKRTKTKKYLEMIAKLGYVSYDSNNEVKFEDILKHQITLLKVVFK